MNRRWLLIYSGLVIIIISFMILIFGHFTWIFGFQVIYESHKKVLLQSTVIIMASMLVFTIGGYLILLSRKKPGDVQTPYRCQTCIDQDIWNTQAMQHKRIVPKRAMQEDKIVFVRFYPTKGLAEILYLLVRFRSAGHEFAPPSR